MALYSSSIDNKAKPVKPLKSGQMFAAILLAVCPSALGLALQETISSAGTPTLEKWKKALATIPDSKQAIAAMQKLLDDPRYTPLFTALLQTKTLQDGSKFNGASAVKEQVWASAGSNVTPRWDNPPHPRGKDIARLIQYLGKFLEEEK